MSEKRNIRLLKLDELKDTLKVHGHQAFRAKQIYQWLWQHGVGDFEEMTNLSKELRAWLSETFVIPQITQDMAQHSLDGTIKIRFKLHDGHLVESVLIPVKKDNRFTLCVSTQVGCSLSCSFCATGKMKIKRNLNAGEIVDQLVLVNRLCEEKYDHPITNIVYMGMGEPLLNYKNVLRSIEIISSEDGQNMSPRRLTISTAGIAKMIRRIADDSPKVNLALSLHAADDVKRDKIMPINESNNLAVLMSALKYYAQTGKGNLTFEYILLNNVNDSIEDANNLAAFCRDFRVKVNIIEYNPIGDGMFDKANPNKTDRFTAHLTKKGVLVTVRRSRGGDIDAACGQLANK